MFADINVDFFGVVLPFGSYGNVGISVTAMNVGDMARKPPNFYPEGTGEMFSANSYAFTLTYARYITSDFAVGANVKYVRENIITLTQRGWLRYGTVFKTPFYGVRFARALQTMVRKCR